jgi:hypothetical protein
VQYNPSLLVFLSLGGALEKLHEFKISRYVDVGNDAQPALSEVECLVPGWPLELTPATLANTSVRQADAAATRSVADSDDSKRRLVHEGAGRRMSSRSVDFAPINDSNR